MNAIRIVKLFSAGGALIALSACAVPVGSYTGAPVEDRSARNLPYQPPTPAPQREIPVSAVEGSMVEVQPLGIEQPFTTEEFIEDDIYQGEYQPIPVDRGPAPDLPKMVPNLPAPAPVANVAPPPAPEEPVDISRKGNPAVIALLDSAAGYVGGGELDKAAGSLERALRIEPRNAGIWHDLGQIRLHQGQYQQAESIATKSSSLAGSDRGLKKRNWKLIAAARRASGDASGADAAEAQAVIAGRG